MYLDEDANSELAKAQGRRIKNVEGVSEGSEKVIVTFEDGSKLTFEHNQDCCEVVSLNDTEGSDVFDLEGATLNSAYRTSDSSGGTVNCDSTTWTFYRLVTSKGILVLRWLGSSNGYYSEDVAVTFSLS